LNAELSAAFNIYNLFQGRRETMKLGPIDIGIILIYLVAVTVIGILFKKIAEKNKKSYMLGGNQLPWYLLGVSNASGMFDISGTMWLVALLFIYGLKSAWLPWLWPVFNQIFLMVYLSAWLRRSNVTTGAEWMATRFGNDRGAKLSHNIVVVFALISCLGFLAYGFVGLGKFMMLFIPWENIAPHVPFTVPEELVPHIYGVVFTAVAVFYTILGGMLSIVWADLIQYFIMTVASLVVGIMAMKALSGHPLAVPAGWENPFFGWKLDLDWRGIIEGVMTKIQSDGYSLFSIFFMMMVFKGFLVSAAGPAPNYDMQKILASKSPKEAAKMSGFVSVILNPVRYFMITGFVVLALLNYRQMDLLVAGKTDFEQILPSAILHFAPVGLLGLILAGLLAAFNGTFAGTLNAGQAYIINDIYLKYIKPKASNKEVRRTNYLVGILLVVVSILFGIVAKDVNSVLQWIVNGLWGGYIASNVLKWYWWRFNGKGYFWGMVSGIILALIPGLLGFVFNMNIKLNVIEKVKFNNQQYVEFIKTNLDSAALAEKGYPDRSKAIGAMESTANTTRIVQFINEILILPEDTGKVTSAGEAANIPEMISLIREQESHSFLKRVSSIHPLYFFPFILLVSTLCSIIVTLKTKPTDEKVLIAFYKSVRPWGFWKPIHDKVVNKDKKFKKNTAFGRDMYNILIGIIAQTCLVVLPVFVIIKNWVAVMITVLFTIITVSFLKLNWYDKLEE
jgi:SSS family solute:Na+ symporter